MIADLRPNWPSVDHLLGREPENVAVQESPSR